MQDETDPYGYSGVPEGPKALGGLGDNASKEGGSYSLIAVALISHRLHLEVEGVRGHWRPSAYCPVWPHRGLIHRSSQRFSHREQ
jgi:hypothetical protein